MNDGANPRGRPALAHTFQSLAMPLPTVQPQPLQPPRRTNFDPVILRGRPPRAHLYQSYASSPGVKLTILAGYGPAGAATFVLSMQPGTKISFGWSTDIFRSYSGKEQRISPFGQPRRRVEGSAFLVDSSSRDVRGAMMRAAASGSTFLLALPFEELSFSADSSARTVFVTSTAMVDWCRPTQRVAVLAVDGSVTSAVVQSSTSTTIVLDVVLGNAGRTGGLIMPLVPVLLDASQGFARYPTRVDTWSLRAQANAFGWTGVDAMGLGSSIVTYTLGVPLALVNITDDDLLIWDRPNAIDGTASESMLSYVDVVDLGALPVAMGGSIAPSWQRSLKFRSRSRADWAWFKAFIRQLRGQQRAFLLSTNRPDLIFVSATADGIKVQSASVVGAGDFVSWYASSAYRRIAVTMSNGAILYREVTTLTDNHDGTLSLVLDQGVVGTVSKISFLEQVRFANPEIGATWNGGVFAIDEPLIVVQDLIDAAALYVFDKIINVSYAYSGIPPDVPPAFQEIGGNLMAGGKTVLINYVSDRSLNFSGIAPPLSGFVDGQVVCISNVNTTSSSYTMGHEDTHSVPERRCLNAGQGSIGGVNKSAWWRYNALASRWINFK